MDKILEGMMSWKGMFNRAFFECREDDCRFVFTTLGQAMHKPEVCPCCEEMNIDYASVPAREKFIQNFRDEMEVFDKELNR